MSRQCPSVPNAVEHESAFLGSVTIDPNTVHRVQFLRPKHFYEQKHGKIWQAMLDVVRGGKHLDFLSLTTQLKSNGDLQSVGGSATVAGLIEKMPSGVYGEEYAEEIYKAYERRWLLNQASKMAQMAHDPSQSPEATRNIMRERLTPSGGVNEDETLNMLVERAEDEITEWLAHPIGPGEVRGLSTGFVALDKLFQGLGPQMTVLAAETSVGKTSVALNVALKMIYEGQSVAVYSAEMNKEQMLYRLLCAQARVNLQKLRGGRLSNQEKQRVQDALNEFRALPLTLIYERNVHRIIDHIYRRRDTFVVIDYLQKLGGGSGENETKRLGNITDLIFDTAHDEQVRTPIWLLSQLSRSSLGGPPSLDRLRGSGRIEENADIVLFLHRTEREPRKMLCLKAKDRLNGGQYTKQAMYFGQFGEIGDLQR